MSSLGGKLTAGLTLPIAGVATAAAKAAIDFESSFAGVAKTVDGVAESNGKLTAFGQQLRDSFRELARTIPVGVNELSAIGETAGAMGIPKETLRSFTEVVAKLGSTTNLSSQEAAAALGHIQNAYAAAGVDSDRFAAALVDLGNKGASTESEIVQFAERMAATGSQLGVSQAQVLGWSNAMASLGINAELGSTAWMRTLNAISVAVDTGSAKLHLFAQTAGMTDQAFSQLFKQNASEALMKFVEGLDRVHAAGGNVTGVLQELGLKSVGFNITLKGLAGAHDMVRQSLETGTKAWQDNAAMEEEFGKRAATVSAQLQVLWNKLYDVAISLGEQLLPHLKNLFPAIENAMRMLAGLVKWFSDLPTGIQTAIIAVAGFVALLGPLLYGFGQLLTTGGLVLKLFTSLGGVSALTTAWTTVISVFEVVGSIVGGLVTVFGGWAVLLTGAVVAAIVAVGVKTGAFQAILSGLWDALKSTIGFFTDLASVIGQGVVAAFQTAWGWISKLANLAIWSDIKSGIQMTKDAFVEWIPDWVKNSISWMVDKIGALATKAKEAATFLRDYIHVLAAVGFGDEKAPKAPGAPSIFQGQTSPGPLNLPPEPVLAEPTRPSGGGGAGGSKSKKSGSSQVLVPAAMIPSLAYGGLTGLPGSPIPGFSIPFPSIPVQDMGSVVPGATDQQFQIPAPPPTFLQNFLGTPQQFGQQLVDIVRTGIDQGKAGLQSVGTTLGMQLLDGVKAHLGAGLGSQLTASVITAVQQGREGLKNIGRSLGAELVFGIQQHFSEGKFGDVINVITSALAHGENPIAAVGGMLGQKLSGSLMKMISSHLTSGLGGVFGGALNAIIPGIGSMLGPLLGDLAGKIGGFFKHLFGGNDVKAMINDQFGSYDALRAKLNELGAAGEQMWIKLTQQTGKGDTASARAQIDAINAALEQHKRELGEAGAAAEQMGTKESEAIAKTKTAMTELDQKLKGLYDSIANEAPEEEMGVVERQTREQIKKLEDEKTHAQSIIDQLNQQVINIPVHLNVTGFDPRNYDPNGSNQHTQNGQGAEAPEPGEPGYPQMASGGIVRATPGGTIVRVAEAGRDEAIVPLGTGSSRGGGVTVIVQRADGYEEARYMLPYLAEEAYRIGLGPR